MVDEGVHTKANIRIISSSIIHLKAINSLSTRNFESVVFQINKPQKLGINGGKCLARYRLEKLLFSSRRPGVRKLLQHIQWSNARHALATITNIL